MQTSFRRSSLVVLIVLAGASAIGSQTPSISHLVVPSFTDLTIKKRHSFGSSSSRHAIQVLYLKGARERHEFLYEQHGRRTTGHVTIMQCDQRRSVELNPEARVYAVTALEQSPAPLWRGRPVPQERGAVVTTTFDAVDTGERRPAGRYVARRVRTTVTVQPSPGANTPASTKETDGWYIDLPGLGCTDATTEAYLAVGEFVGPSGMRDRHQFRTKGAARRGYAIEETTRFIQAGTTAVDHVELIELSEDPLDSSLFDAPTDYRPALPLVRGGHDMTRVDTLANRLQMYWGELTLVTRSIFR
jgi:hypothetical protein